MDVSIIIPIKNGGKRFDEVLSAVDSQNTLLEYEVICVDSGSTDNSVEIALDHGCKVLKILPEEYGHGRTRNYAAKNSSGEFIVVLTQDAIPVNDKWLDNLIGALKDDDDVAGVFGKHLPYPDCNLPDQLMLKEHFERFDTDVVDKNRAVYKTNAGNVIYQLTDENRKSYFEDEGYRQYLAFFSDNCACLRRSVWEKIPYDDVDFSEDQLWARKILETGYKKAYCEKACVYHSHNYSLKSYKKRYFDEFKALFQIYGLNLSDSIYSAIRGVLGDTKHQCAYIIRKNEMTVVSKVKWCMYSFIRNIYRYHSAYKAVAYYSQTDEIKKQWDEKYSQQYQQLH